MTTDDTGPIPIETEDRWALEDELEAAQARIAELEAQLAASKDRIAELVREIPS